MDNRTSRSTLWPVGTAITTAGVSAIAKLNGPHVMLYIDNEGSNSHVFTVQVSHGTGAGRNDISAAADGGLVWYDLQEPDLSASVTITVASGVNQAYSLSNCGAPYLRLYCVSGTSNAISAFVTSNSG